MVELLNCKSVTGKRAYTRGQPAWTMLPARHVVTNMSAYMNYLTDTCISSHYHTRRVRLPSLVQSGDIYKLHLHYKIELLQRHARTNLC